MPSLLLARGRALAGCACAALAVAVAGCTSTTASTSGTSISGHTLTIWVSIPHGTLSPEAQDVLSAEQLALPQSGMQIGKFNVKPVRATGNELSANARGAIADSTTIAYLGELEPGTSAQTIGITNAEDVLQVSPTDTAAELTQAVPAAAGSPDVYYESLSTYGRTFARVVPSDKLEASALVGEMKSLGVKRLDVASDGSAYGSALRSAVIGDSSGAGIAGASTTGGADAVLYAGSSTTGATQTFDQAASSNPSVKLFAPSALAEASFASGLSPAAQRDLVVSSPGLGSAELPTQGRQFVSAFKSAYGHDPAPQAIFGYAAMKAILYVLQKAGSSANSRSTVVHDFFAIRDLSSAIGSYSIDKNGDVVFASGAPFVFSRVKDGKLVPFRAVQEQG